MQADAAESAAVYGRIRHHAVLTMAARLVKSNVVLLVALVAAGITCIFVPFDEAYADYFDWSTIACLFCTLAVVAAFKNIRFFVWLADVIVRRFKNMRNITLALVFVTFFGSMIMANDMALVTFLPLGYFVLESCGNKKLTAFVFIMQDIAANLGGMLTPFGNPQNLYLYSYYSIPTGEFFSIMALPFAAAFVMIFVICMFVKSPPLCSLKHMRVRPCGAYASMPRCSRSPSASYSASFPTTGGYSRSPSGCSFSISAPCCAWTMPCF